VKYEVYAGKNIGQDGRYLVPTFREVGVGEKANTFIRAGDFCLHGHYGHYYTQ
jgi:hypothetical protein